MGAAVVGNRPGAAEGLTSCGCASSGLRAARAVRPSALDRELAEELRFHFDRQVQANLDAGMAPDQARRAAPLSIGHPSRVGKRRATRAPARSLGSSGATSVRCPAAAQGAWVLRRRHRHRRARHRIGHRYLQHRLRRPSAAAAVPRSRSPGQRVDQRAAAAGGAPPGQRRRSSRLARGQSRVRRHRALSARRQLQPDRRGRAGTAVRLRASRPTCSRSLA